MKYLIKVILILFPLFSHAQFVDDGELGCGTTEFFPNFRTLKFSNSNEAIYTYLNEQNYFTTDSQDFIKYRVPLKFWIYTKKDGSGNVNKEDIKKFMSDLNHYNIINKTGFRYYLSGIDYIKKNRHHRLGYYWEAPIQSFIHKEKGAINVFIAGNIRKGNTTVRGTYNKISKSVLTKQHTSRTSLAHEIGHYFGLLHPHRGYNANKCKQEAVNRNRVYKGCLLKHGKICEKSGDKLCDTPAEPRLSKAVNRNCEYTGDFKDNWGEKYTPDINNIMSYPAYRRCRDRFTPGQVALMLYTAEKNKYAKYWTATKNNQPKNIQFAFDRFEPDNDLEMASEIKTENTHYHSFHSIFKGKGKKTEKDNVDWVKFTIFSYMKTKAELTFSNGNSVFPKMEITIFDANGKTITKRNIDKNNQKPIILEGLPIGKYFVKIKTEGNNSFADFNLHYKN
ncbi:MAG: zinc-dependent metalloprotease [Bacteroidales bacterium]|nr:zinc-dependent metalloprotease [Bacteroidales bacterium]